MSSAPRACPHFSDQSYATAAEPPQNDRFEYLRVFIHQGRHNEPIEMKNVAIMRRPCMSVPNLAWIGHRVCVHRRLRSSQKVQNWSFVWLYMYIHVIVAYNYVDHGKILVWNLAWKSSLHHGPALACQIWPRLGMVVGTGAPKLYNLIKIAVWGFLPLSHFLSFPRIPL